MSLVGPRPEREFFVKQFEQFIPEYYQRMWVKPGITGLAQVLGRYSTMAGDKLRFDLVYIHNYSTMLDLKILLQTIPVICRREQAKGVFEPAVSALIENCEVPDPRLLMQPAALSEAKAGASRAA